MVGFTVTKGATVEVSSDEPGFYGAWYVATIVAIIEASPTKKMSSSKKKKNINKLGYLIKYDTLYENENLEEHLTEVVDPSSVRPLPPVMVEDGGGSDFEVNDVIDADHRDGWWIGVINKVIVDGENKKFVVEFENPREEFEFNKSQLRLHVDWVDGVWVVPPKKTAELELGDKNTSGFTTPVKGTLRTGLENQSVGSKVSTRKRSRSQKKIESNVKMVGKVDGSGTASRGRRSQSSTGRKGYKKVKVPVMEKCGSQAINQNSVLVDQEMITTETFNNSQQKKKRGRPSKLKFQVTSPNGVQQGSSCPIKQHLEPAGALNQAMVNNGGTNELNGAPNQAVVNDGAPDEPNGAQNQAVVNNGESNEPNGATNPAIVNNGATDEAKGAPNQAVVNNGGTDEPSGASNESIVIDGATNEPNGAPNQTIVINGGTDEPSDASNQAIVNNGSTNEPMGALNQAVVNNGGTDEPMGTLIQAVVNNGGTSTDYQQEWPFIKRSIVWAAIESLESYQKPPQRPHFSPLSEIKQDFREGLAIAHMVTFSTLFQMISKLQLSDPNDIINNSLETLVELETHGFDVNLLRARLNELLHWKLKVDQHKGKLTKFEEQVEKFKVEKCEVEDKIKQLKLKIKELDEQMAENVKIKNVKDDQIADLQSNSKLVSIEIMDWELAFEKLKATPF